MAPFVLSTALQQHSRRVYLANKLVIDKVAYWVQLVVYNDNCIISYLALCI